MYIALVGSFIAICYLVAIPGLSNTSPLLYLTFIMAWTHMQVGAGVLVSGRAKSCVPTELHAASLAWVLTACPLSIAVQP